MYSKKIDYLIFIIFLLNNLLALFSYYVKEQIYFFYSLFFLVFINIFEIINRRNYLHLLFLISFIFFQMSRLILFYFGFSNLDWGRGYIGDYFNNNIKWHVLYCFYLVFLGLFLSNYIKIQRRKKIESIKNKYFKYTNHNHKVILLLCLFFLVFSILQNIFAIKHVINNGYFSYYRNFSPPYILTVFTGFSYVFIFCYLSIARKLNIIFKILYFTNLFSNLLIGSRKEFVLFLMLLLYYFWNIRGSFSVSSIIKLFLPIILLFTLLFFWGFIREKAVNDIFKYKTNPFVLFVDSQGVSVVVPSYAKKYEKEIPKKGLAYLFPNQIQMIQNLFGTSIPKSERKRDALEGFYISKFISYKVLGDRFILGEGLGGSFIADIYYCFSYTGIFIFSFFLGILMKILINVKKNTISYVISLSIIFNLLYIPRSQAFEFLLQITSLKFWIAIIIYTFLNDFITYIFGKQKK